MGAEYLTVSEVSEYLKLPEETVYKYARTGRMPASKVGRYWRFERSRIDEWVRQNSNAGQHACRVLIVDDDPVVRNLLTKWTLESGADATAAASGEEAIRLVADAGYELILLDLMMPTLNGVKTLAEIRRIRPEQEVVIITAYFDSEMMEEASAFGPLRILKKPVDKNALQTLLAAPSSKSG